MKLIKKHGNKIALLLSVTLLATAVIGGTLAYVVTKTPSLLNTFYADHSGDILIEKEVEHPFGDTYQIPGNIKFDFAVNLGEGYAKKDVTVFFPASEQNGTVVKTANAEGVITVSIKPGQTAIIKDVTVGTEVEVEEINLGENPGFSVKDGAKHTYRVEKEGYPLKYVNEYNPAPAPANLTVHGTKVINGRDWIAGDRFTMILEKRNNNNEWEELGRAVTEYKTETTTVDGTEVISVVPDMDKFSFTDKFTDDAGKSIFTQAGTYFFRIREERGSIPDLIYDTTNYAFDVLVEDKNMDGALEIQSVTPAYSSLNNLDITGTTDGGFDVEATVTNRYAPGSAQVTIEIKKQVVSNSVEDKSPEGFTFKLYDKEAGSLVKEVSSSTTGDATITLEYNADDVGKSFDYILEEWNDGKAGWDYDTTKYPITVNVVDNNDGTISAYIGETDDNDADDDDQSIGNNVTDASLDVGEQQNGEQQSEEQEEQQPDGEQQNGEQLDNQQNTEQQDNEQQNGESQQSSDEGASSTEVEIGGADDIEGDGNGDEVIINTSVENAAQSTTVYLTAKRFTNVPNSAVKLTAGNENDDIPEVDASGTSAPIETPDPNGAAQIDFSTGRSNGETSFEAVFTNTYTPTPAKGESIPGKKILNGRELNAGEFEFALYTVEEDGDLDKKLLTVNNDVNGEFVFDMSTEYSKVGVYEYAVVEVKDDLGGVTYDEARFDIIVTVTDNNGNLEAKTVIKDKLGAELGAEAEIKFVNEYVPAKASFAIGGKKELKGDAYSGEAFSFSLYKADSAFAKVGTALETVNKSEAGSFTFAQIDYTEAGEHYYLVEEVKGSVAGMVYDSTVYGVTVTVTDNGLGQLIVDHETVKIGGDEVEEILFSNTYTKPAVTPTPTIPVTPTPTPGIMPTPPLDDVEIPIYPDDSGVPPTGDDNPIGLYVAILLISAGAIAGLVVTGKTGKKYRKRKKRFHAR